MSLWVALFAIGACSDAPRDVDPVSAWRSSITTNGLTTNGLTTNGLTTNGLTTNGLTTNGLTTNGLTTNGLTTNGLGAIPLTTVSFASSSFVGWFDEAPDRRAMLMSYVMRCAALPGDTVTFHHRGHDYSWSGGLGFAPGWASGHAASAREEALVTGCLAAHLNAFGKHVEISVQGRAADDVPVALVPGELESFSVREGCFFGNAFSGSAMYVGDDNGSLAPELSSYRSCAFRSGATECAPLVHIGSCGEHCQLDPSGTFYTSCEAAGHRYPAITTRIPASALFTCGDGVCEATEHCGTGRTADSCGVDCGACPASW